MTACDGPPSADPSSRAPAAAATCSGVHSRIAEDRPQLFPGDGDIVERDLDAARELLTLLVALAGDHDDIAAARSGQRAADRGAAVGDPLGAGGALDHG